jgi:trk system potassium uptake protein TrkH
VRALVGIVVTLVFVFTMWRWHTGGVSFEESLRHVLFTLSSIISTTGYASTDYCAWGSFAVIVSLFATYIGGAGGSTAGGPKTMRLIIAAKMVGRQIKTMLYPNGSFPVYYQGKSVDEEAAMNVLGFLSFYVFINVVLSIGVAMTGADFLTAVSAVATTTANAGNGVGPVIGPSGNFSSLSDTAKWILSLAMLLGRLEILTVVVLFTRNYWLK